MTSYPYILLPVPHAEQQHAGDCLPACAMMALAYIGRTVRYRRLLRILGTQDHGTPFSNLRRLNQLGVTVVVGTGDFDQLYTYLTQNRPCIVSVQTAELPHWNRRSEHAVIVVGMDSAYVYLNDPAFEIAPILVPHGDLDLAWLAQGELYAVVDDV